MGWLVASIIAATVVALILAMRWAERRDRGRGHRNRSTREMMSAIRAGKEHKINLQLSERRRRR